MRVFLSYRRSDVGGYAGRLTDILVRRLGRKRIFHDVTVIAPGEDFTAAIDTALDECDAVLAVIGPGWLTAVGTDGPRLFQPHDYVRLEVSRALARNRRVVPVLVGGARLPRPEDLPEDLRQLTRRQAVVLHDETWHDDVEGLLRSLRGGTEAPAGRVRWMLAAAVVLLLLGGLGWWAGARLREPADPGAGQTPGSGGTAATIQPCDPPEGEGWTEIALQGRPSADVVESGGTLTFQVTAAHAKRQGERWQVTLSTTVKNDTDDASYHSDWRYDAISVALRRFPPTCYSPNPELVEQGAVGDALLGFEVTCEPSGYLELVLQDGRRVIITDPALPPSEC